MSVDLCGVRGDVTPAPGDRPEPVPPCANEANNVVRFRCERGHERERKVCDAHALILFAQLPFAPTFCVVCFDADGTESLLTPLDSERAS